MQAIKKTKEYTVLKKRSGRHAVIGPDNKFIRGDDKAKILLKEKLITVTPPKPKEEKPADAPAAS